LVSLLAHLPFNRFAVPPRCVYVYAWQPGPSDAAMWQHSVYALRALVL